MTRRLRRFEVLLPLRFNSGEAVPSALFEQTRRELEDHFGALSLETQVIHGLDRESGAQADRLMRMFADVADTPENLAYFYLQKKRWRERFQQAEIWITTFAIEVL